MNPIDIVKTHIQAGRAIPSYEALLPKAMQRQPLLSRSTILNKSPPPTI
jgi:hypothetical protein